MTEVVEIRHSKNAQIVLDSIEVIFNRAEVDRIPEFYTEDFRSHQGGFGLWEWKPGRDGLRDHITMTKTAWPDYREDPEIVFTDDDLVIIRMTISGTNTGDAVFPATNRRFEVKDMMICRIRDGKLHEQWGLTDHYTMLVQLGLIDTVV